MAEKNMPSIGKAWIKDIGALLTWYAASAPEWHDETRANGINFLQGDTKKYLVACLEASRYHRDQFGEYRLERITSSVKKAYEYANEYKMAFGLTYLDDRMAVVKHGSLHLLIPPEFIRYELFINYDTVGSGDMSLLCDSEDDTKSLNMLPAAYKTSRLSMDGIRQSASDVQEEIKSVENKTHKDIAPLYAEIERLKEEMETKKSNMMAMMETLLEDLETKKYQLEGQIFLLDSQIYSIRCFQGEVVDFTAIRSGSPAPEATPVVMYQKVRYLDEELGQLTSIYRLQGGSYKVIEELLKYNDVAFERFCPSPKCVTVLRVSRSGKVLAPHPTWANFLDAFEFHHSHRVCVLIRNGDALHAGWTDEERIDIAEDAFYLPGEQAEDPDEDKTESMHETAYSKKERIKQARIKTKEEMERRASRMFLFTILQGLLERKEILSLPEKYSIIKSMYERNPYIIFSAADNWLESNAYPVFSELLQQCNRRVQAGDCILTLLGLRAENNREYSSHHNDRGIGYNNRTHDVCAENATVYPVNKVVLSDEYRLVRYTSKECREQGFSPWRTRVSIDAPKGDALIGAYRKTGSSMTRFSEGTIILSDEVTRDRTCYVSLEKSYSLSGARANFQVNPEEYINLTYMNSVWLLYIISSKKLGAWQVGGKDVSYAYAIRYLNKALEFVRDREITERALILAEYPTLDTVNDWPVKLSEWKLDKEVRQITAYQAKRFARYLGQGDE